VGQIWRLSQVWAIISFGCVGYDCYQLKDCIWTDSGEHITPTGNMTHACKRCHFCIYLEGQAQVRQCAWVFACACVCLCVSVCVCVCLCFWLNCDMELGPKQNDCTHRAVAAEIVHHIDLCQNICKIHTFFYHAHTKQHGMLTIVVSRTIAFMVW
jgi:hypothetical protein